MIDFGHFTLPYASRLFTVTVKTTTATKQTNKQTKNKHKKKRKKKRKRVTACKTCHHKHKTISIQKACRRAKVPCNDSGKKKKKVTAYQTYHYRHNTT